VRFVVDDEDDDDDNDDDNDGVLAFARHMQRVLLGFKCREVTLTGVA